MEKKPTQNPAENPNQWLSNYLQAYDAILYKAYKDKLSSQEFTAKCRELKENFSSEQLMMSTVFELCGTWKILNEEAKRWGDTKRCRYFAWQAVLELFQKLEQPLPEGQPKFN